VPIVKKSGSLDLLEPSGPVQACNGTAASFMSEWPISSCLCFIECSFVIRHVQLPDAGKLSIQGLRVLKGHKISNLEVSRMVVTVNDLIGCLGEWTLQNMRSLNVAHSTFVDGSR
jgi:hypothetical protein